MLASAPLKVLLGSGALTLSPCHRPYYRCVQQSLLYGFVPPAPLFSGGSSARGARFTPRGGPNMLYMAEDPLTAYAEANQAYTRVQGLAPATVPPVPPPAVLFGINVQIGQVLDLGDAAIQSALQTSVAELTANWRLHQPAPTQVLGEFVYDSGLFQAIRYPSARHLGGFCLVVFPDRIADPDYVEVFDPSGDLTARIP